MTAFRFLLNGEPVEVRAPGMRRLLDVLRDDLGLTGTKEGCGEGECGACSVIVDSQLVVSCLVPLCQVDGHTVRTVEGLAALATRPAPDGEGSAAPPLSPLQRAFLETGAAQCGICTPGMLMAARAYLDDDGDDDEAAIRSAIAGNLCRCTGYSKIVDAIALAAVEERAGRAAPPGAGEPPEGPGVPPDLPPDRPPDRGSGAPPPAPIA